MDPTSPSYGPAEIAAATNGQVTSSDLRNWVRDHRFNTPLPEPKAGKPRAFSMAAVQEAAILAALSELGVPLSRAKAWVASLLPRIASGQVPEYLVWAPGARVPYLPPAGPGSIEAAPAVLGGSGPDAPVTLCILRLRALLDRLKDRLQAATPVS
jgi:hypothetical protein